MHSSWRSSDNDTNRGRSRSQVPAVPSSTGLFYNASNWLSDLFMWSGAVDTRRSVGPVQTNVATSLVPPVAEESTYDGAEPGGSNVEAHENQDANDIVSGAAPHMDTVLPQRLLVRYKKLVVARRSYMLAQSQKVNEMQKYVERRRFCEESIAALIDKFSSQTIEGLRVTASASFEDPRNQLLQDWHALKQQSSIVADMEATTSSHQYSIERAEKRFMKSLREYVARLPKGESSADTLRQIEEAPNSDDGGSTEAFAEIPDLARLYFERHGEKTLLEEQILDREERYHDEKESRDIRRDQDIEPELPDHEFEIEFETERGALLSRLELTTKAVDRLRTQCTENSIDVDALRFKGDQSQTATSSSSSIALMDDDEGEIYAMLPSRLYDLQSGARDVDLGLLDGGIAAVIAPHDSANDTRSQKGYEKIEGWLSDVNEGFVTRQQQLRANNRTSKRRRCSDSAFLGDYFHEGEERR